MSEPPKRPPSEPHALERKISTALAANAQTTASNLAAWVRETEAAIIAADAAAAREKERAFDPALTPDPVKARQAMEDAQFAANRPRTLRPRLVQRWQEAQSREEAARYSDKCAELQAETEALEQDFDRLYRDCAGRIIGAFQSIREFRSRTSRELGPPPAGVEALRPFDSGIVRLLEQTQLYALDGKTQLWPDRHSGQAAAAFVQSMSVAAQRGGVGPYWPIATIAISFAPSARPSSSAMRFVTNRPRPNRKRGSTMRNESDFWRTAGVTRQHAIVG
jgi:hypothetical protein